MSENLTQADPTHQPRLIAAPVVADVIRYWANLRNGNHPPRRDQIDASAIPAALPDVFLAEFLTPRIARMRICGQRIENLLGMDMRGMPLTALFKGAAREELIEALEQVALGARVTLSLEGESGFGRPRLTAVLGLLPLCDESGRITRVMGVLECSGDRGRSPRRFTLARPVATSVTDIPTNAPNRPVLRVVDGGKP